MKNIILLFALFTSFSSFVHGASVGEDTLLIGEKNSTSDKLLKLGSSRLIRSNESSGEMEFSNDGGVNWKKVGSGSGSGAGVENLLLNDSFEDGVGSPWVSSGGTLTQESYAFGIGSNLKYFQYVSTVAGQYIEQAVIIPSNFSTGCQVDLKKINIATSDLFKVEATDSTGAVVYASSNVKSSNWIKFPTLSFRCPTAGSIVKIRITSLAAGTLQGDKAYLGSNQGFIPSDKMNVFSAKIQNNGAASVISSSADFIQSVNRVSLGRVQVLFKIGFFTQPPAITLGLEGGDDDKNIHFIGSPSTSGFEVIVRDQGIQNDQSFHFSATKQGVDAVSSQEAISNDQASWHIDANIGGSNLTLTTGAVSSYVEMLGPLDLVINTDKGSAQAQIACPSGTDSSGLTCPASESVGISFTPPMNGIYEACFSFTSSVYDNVGVFFQVIETENTSTTILSEGGTRTGALGSGATYMPHTNCGVFNFSNVSKKTLRLMYEKGGNTTQDLIIAERDASYGQRDIHVTVRPILSAYNRPILTGDQVTTRAPLGSEKGACHIINTGTASFDAADPDCWFVSSVSWVSTARVRVNFLSSGFKCSLTPLEVAMMLGVVDNATSPIDTAQLPASVDVLAYVHDGLLSTDASFSMSCSLNKQL